MDWYTQLDVVEKILSALAALILESSVIVASIRKLRIKPTIDLQKVMMRSVCLPLGNSESRIFHAQWPYILPICFKHPKRSEYVYVVVGGNTNDKRDLIVIEPHLSMQSISSIPAGTTRWYQLTSEVPLQSIKFGKELHISDFTKVNAEFYPMGTWNNSNPVEINRKKKHAYALGITEQLGSSIWFVAIDNYEYIFNQNQGCHFVEFVLTQSQQHSLSIGYKQGGLGIACAFFAY